MTTYALIPGGGGDPWDWHLVTRELEARGHDVVPVRLPAEDENAGWAEYADAIVTAIGNRRDVTLVAHSLGGFSAPLVCERRPVDMLVLLNAMVPRPGETGSDWGANTGSAEAAREYRAEIGLTREEADDDAVLYYHDVPAEVAAEAAQRPEPGQSWTPMTQAWPLAAWPDVPTRVLIGRDDRLFPASFQSRVARERLGIEGIEISGGHMAALSNPRGIVECLEEFHAELNGSRR